MNGKIVAASDDRQNWDIKCYDNAYQALKFINIPTALNKLSESKIWYAKQPAHLKREVIKLSILGWILDASSHYEFQKERTLGLLGWNYEHAHLQTR
jgi:hypothetical protein